MDFANPTQSPHPPARTLTLSASGAHGDTVSARSTTTAKTCQQGSPANDDALALGLCGLMLVLSIGLLWFSGRKRGKPSGD